jgi:Mg2+ and Co2+ transporter CorA
MQDNAHAPPPPETALASVRAFLFDGEGHDRDVDLDKVDVSALTERQLLWVDVEDDDASDAAALIDSLVQQLQLGPDAAEVLKSLDGRTDLASFGDWFLAQAVAVEHEGGLRFKGRGLAIVCGHNLVVSLHRGPLQFLDELRGRERADTRLGTLSAESFTASLLGWLVDSYLHAVSDFEAAVDRLEVSVLSARAPRESLKDLADLRRGASRLRRMLAPHRHVFGAMARPDFRPDDAGIADKHFRALEQRFERAMDAVENARDLVVGSFELFATRSSERTNDTMRTLTFVTVLLGTLSVVAGTLGMNFAAPFFDTGGRGFWSAFAGMALVAVVAIIVARWRRWI